MIHLIQMIHILLRSPICIMCIMCITLLRGDDGSTCSGMGRTTWTAHRQPISPDRATRRGASSR